MAICDLCKREGDDVSGYILNMGPYGPYPKNFLARFPEMHLEKTLCCKCARIWMFRIRDVANLPIFSDFGHLPEEMQ
jgi:hypothetical protein